MAGCRELSSSCPPLPPTVLLFQLSPQQSPCKYPGEGFPQLGSTGPGVLLFNMRIAMIRCTVNHEAGTCIRWTVNHEAGTCMIRWTVNHEAGTCVPSVYTTVLQCRVTIGTGDTAP